EEPQVAAAPLREHLLRRELGDVERGDGHCRAPSPPLAASTGSGFSAERGPSASDSSVRTFSALPPVPPPTNGAGVHHDHSVHETHCCAQKFPVACQRRIARIRAPFHVARTPPFFTFPSGV